MHYIPLTLPFFVGLFLLFVFLVILIEIRILEYAYELLGVKRRYVFVLLFFSLLGSYVNLPVGTMHGGAMESDQVVSFYGIQYVIPRVIESSRTVIAVNVGGALIPFLLSLYLVFKMKLYGRALLAVSIVTIIVHTMAYPVRGVGIAEPIFIPPLVATVVALLISKAYAAPLAYVGGSVGTLIGADLLNLDQITGLGAPVASIGGAGTFDGIFMTGILAVLVAAIMTGKRSSPS
ncbi:MAG: DUF1614 domain-containing protein [Desulfobacterales bacterium]|jgi:uncharacterized membrane protein